jgi:hypothetical protein
MRLIPGNAKASADQMDDLLLLMINSTPELLNKIAPQGFINSEFYYHYRETPGYKYKIYRQARASRYLFNKRHRPLETAAEIPDLLTMEEFLEQEYEPRTCSLPDEAIAILLESFRCVFSSASFIIDPDLNVYLYPETDLFDKIVRRVLPLSAQSVADDFSFSKYFLHPFKTYSKVNMYQVVLHVFEVLKASGFNWIYRSEYLQYLIDLNKEIADKNEMSLLGKETDAKGNLEVMATFLQLGTYNEETGKMEYPQFSEEFDNVCNTEKKSDELKAYYEVYQQWPQGYPPQITDYI